MSPNLVSIVTASHNSAPFLSSTLKSITDQSYQDWELIVVDDKSTDDSADIVDEAARHDPRIKQIRLTRNSGPAVARNTAIEAANGRFIAFLDSDDEWMPDKLSLQTEFMRQNDYAFTYTYYERMTEEGELTGVIATPPDSLDYAALLKSNKIGCLTAMYDVSQTGKRYMPQLRKRQDYGLWLDLLRSGVVAYCLPQVLARYRVRRGSVSSNKLDLFRFNWQLYRHVEHLSWLRSSYYLGWNVIDKLSGRYLQSSG